MKQAEIEAAAEHQSTVHLDVTRLSDRADIVGDFRLRDLPLQEA